MCKAVCPFAAALFGSAAGTAAGSASGAASGWLLYAAYAGSGGRDAGGLVGLMFGLLGLGVGMTGGAVGGLIQGWSPRSSRASAEGWGAALGILWGLQPILWLSLTADPATAARSALVILAAVSAVGAMAAAVGGVAARSLGRTLAPRAYPRAASSGIMARASGRNGSGTGEGG